MPDRMAEVDDDALSHDAGADFERRGNLAVAAKVFAARAFGTSRDLDFDFANPDRPAVLTQLLVACFPCFEVVPDADNIVWQWTVAERLQGLLAIVLATRAGSPPVTTHCQASTCRMPMQLELALAAFVEEPRRDPVVCELADGQRVTARLPRGIDQRCWRQADADPIWMATRLVESVDGHIPEPGWHVPLGWVDAVAAGLAEHDPLTVLQLKAICPNCGQINLVDFDLEDWLLRLLADEQKAVLDDVHSLAAVYHWSEADICALPRRRRRAYLTRVGREASP